MKAAVIQQNGGSEALHCEDLPDPVCADDGVVIEVETVSIEGGDLLARLMTPPASASHVVGYTAAGTLRAIRAKVRGRTLGERVVTLAANGSHAQQRAASAAMVWAIPDGLSTRHAAGVPVAFGTAHECLFNAGDLQKGQTVLIHARRALRPVLQAEYPRAYALVADCPTRVASGELRVEIAKVFALSEAAQAHTYVEGRHAFGRDVMTT